MTSEQTLDFLREKLRVRFNPNVEILCRCSSPLCYSEWHLIGYTDMETAIQIHDPFQDSVPCWVWPEMLVAAFQEGR